MMTPPGRDCSYYYEDRNRGANISQCRIARGQGSDAWHFTQCKGCPVPDIENANGSRLLQLTLTVRSNLLGFRQRFDVESWCVMHGPVEDPHVGCVECARQELGDLAEE